MGCTRDFERYGTFNKRDHRLSGFFRRRIRNASIRRPLLLADISLERKHANEKRSNCFLRRRGTGDRGNLDPETR
jgi:hypothetical protein